MPQALRRPGDLQRAPSNRLTGHRSIERFIQTLQVEWAYAASYRDHWQRRRALMPWLSHYNCRRPHSALGHKTPISRIQADERS